MFFEAFGQDLVVRADGRLDFVIGELFLRAEDAGGAMLREERVGSAGVMRKLSPNECVRGTDKPSQECSMARLLNQAWLWRKSGQNNFAQLFP